jgi:DNA-binding FadR family transcriptional regulator
MEIGQQSMPAAIPETKGRTIAEHRAIADGVALGNVDAAGEAMRAHLVAAGQRLRTLCRRGKREAGRAAASSDA